MSGHPYVARILECRDKPPGVCGVVVNSPIRLFPKYLFLFAAPPPLPGFVRPRKTKRKIWPAGCKHVVERTLEQPLSAEPVVPAAEAADTVASRQGRLRLPRLRNAQIVETEVGRNMRLVMAVEQRLSLRHVRPFSEAFSPPAVVAQVSGGTVEDRTREAARAAILWSSHGLLRRRERCGAASDRPRRLVDAPTAVPGTAGRTSRRSAFASAR